MAIIKLTNQNANIITAGTFADSRISSSSVSQHATSFDDDKIINDLSTLGLRVHTQENLNVSNTNSASFDVFNDATGIASLTSCSRDTLLEHISTKSFGGTSLIDFDNIDGNGLDVKYKTSGSNLTNESWGVTSFTNISDYSAENSVDSNYWLSNFTGRGGGMGSMNTLPADTTDRTNIFMIFDFGATYNFEGVWYVGKQNGYGDLRKVRFQSSTDDSSYSNIDLSGVSTTTVTRSDASMNNGSKTGGEVTSASSDGSFIMTQHGGQYFGTVNTMANFPSTDMRYLKIMLMNQWSGSANANANINFNITKKLVTFNASGNFIGANITAPSTVSKMGAVITYTETGTNTLNTDIIMQLSSDGGSNFTTATLTPLPDFSSGVKMAKVNDLSLTGGTGTNCTYKILFANQADGSKVANLKGVSLQY